MRVAGICLLFAGALAAQRSLSVERTLPWDGESAGVTAFATLHPEGKRWLEAVPDDRGIVINPVISPDRRWLAYGRMEGWSDSRVFVQPIAGGPARQIQTIAPAGNFTWSTDSRHLIVATGERGVELPAGEIALYDALATGQRLRQLTARGQSPALSPDGRRLAFTRDNEIRLLPLNSKFEPAGAEVVVTREASPYLGAIVWVPGGSSILYQTWAPQRSLLRVAATAGAAPEPLELPDGDIEEFRFALDGAKAFALTRSRTESIWRVDLNTRNAPVTLFQQGKNRQASFRISPDGKNMAYVSTSPRGMELWRARIDGSGAIRLASHPHYGFGGPIWSPAGDQIAFLQYPSTGNADLRSWLFLVPAAGGKVQRLVPDADEVRGISWSRTGDSIYYSRPVRAAQDQLWKLRISDRRSLPVNGVMAITAQDNPADGALIASPGPYPKLYSYPPGAAKLDLLWPVELKSARSFAVSANGIYAIPRRNDKTIWLIHPESRAAEPVLTLPFPARSIQILRTGNSLFITEESPTRHSLVFLKRFW